MTTRRSSLLIQALVNLQVTTFLLVLVCQLESSSAFVNIQSSSLYNTINNDNVNNKIYNQLDPLKPLSLLQKPASLVVPHRTTQTTRLWMGWGPDPVWSQATVLENQDACESGRSVLLKLKIPVETLQEYTTPGQYVQVQVNDKDPAFLAILNPPGSENAVFDFLVKKTDNNDWLTSLSPNTNVQISQVLGNGFSIADNLDDIVKYDFPTQNVLLFAAGSGLAPIVSAMESGQLKITESNRGCKLYYGERTMQDLCLTDRFQSWSQECGVEIVPVLSQPSDSWEGRCGYIQTALQEDGVPVPRNSAALLCGMKGMTESVSEELKTAGVFDGRILFNF